MSYRCQACSGKCPPRQPRLMHQIKRMDGSILTEFSVCATCQAALASGAKLSDLTPKQQPQPVPEGDVPPPAAS